MGLNSSLLLSQQPTNCPYPEPHVSTPHLHTVFFKIQFNIILPRRPSYSKLFLPFRFPHKNTSCIAFSHHTCYMPRSSRTSLHDHPSSAANDKQHCLHKAQQGDPQYVAPATCDDQYQSCRSSPAARRLIMQQ
jgi:hypothetical protein